MKGILTTVWAFIKKHIWIIVIVILALYYFVFAENSWLVINRLKRELNDLNREAAMLENDIKQDSIEATSLFSSKEALEIYGREHYYMKRPNEDIFIVNDNKKK